MLNPVTYDLVAYTGGTWDQEFLFWDDAGATIPHDFTGWTLTFTLTLPGPILLTPPVILSGNSVSMSIPYTTTAGWTVGAAGHWILSMVDTAVPPNVEYLMHGAFTVQAP